MPNSGINIATDVLSTSRAVGKLKVLASDTEDNKRVVTLEHANDVPN